MSGDDEIERARAIRAERLKAELQARHAAAPDDDVLRLPAPAKPGTGTPEGFAQYENHLPPQVRAAGRRADELVRRFSAEPTAYARAPRHWGMWITNAPALPRRGRHGVTGGPKGRPPERDIGLAGAVYSLMSRGLTRAEAVAVIAQWLAKISSSNSNSARERVYRAMRH